MILYLISFSIEFVLQAKFSIKTNKYLGRNTFRKFWWGFAARFFEILTCTLNSDQSIHFFTLFQTLPERMAEILFSLKCPISLGMLGYSLTLGFELRKQLGHFLSKKLIFLHWDIPFPWGIPDTNIGSSLSFLNGSYGKMLTVPLVKLTLRNM